MNKKRQRRALSTHTSHHPEPSLCEGCKQRQQASPMCLKKQKGKDKRCISVKGSSKVTSYETSKVTSVRKPKSKQRMKQQKPVILISEQETPVLGKYYIASNHVTSPQNDKLQTINKNNQQQQIRDQQCEEQSNLSQVVQESSIKAPLSIKSQLNCTNLLNVMPPKQVQERLDQTIDKLKSKQQTIEILNKTIQTRIVDASSAIGEPRKILCREDAYEVEMNFYVDKITELQKQLYQKNRLLKAAQFRNEQFSTLSRNTKRLIKQNTRLREELQLSGREITALRKLLMKAQTRGK